MRELDSVLAYMVSCSIIHTVAAVQYDQWVCRIIIFFFLWRLELIVPRQILKMSASGDGTSVHRKVIGTHSGTFHCDEALACFMLKKLPEYANAGMFFNFSFFSLFFFFFLSLFFSLIFYCFFLFFSFLPYLFFFFFFLVFSLFSTSFFLFFFLICL